MSVRSIVQKAMVASPLLLVGSLAAQSGLFRDPFETVSCTPAQQDAITAYIEPVKASLVMREADASPNTIRKVANVWIRGAAEGRLRPLTPSCYEDSMRSPIKSQIKAANDAVVVKLIALSAKERQENKYSQAAEDALYALLTSDVIKYSDPVSVAVQGASQRSILTELSKIASKLDPAERNSLKSKLAKFKENEQSLQPLVRLVELNYNRELQRHTINERASSDPLHVYDMGNYPDIAPVKLTLTGLESAKISKGSHPNGQPYLLPLKLAFSSERRLNAEIDKLVGAPI